MNIEEQASNIMKECESLRYLSTPRNNRLLLEILKAKSNGCYGRVMFEAGSVQPLTLLKKARNLKKVDRYFKKDFDRITEEELIKYRDLFNADKILKDKTLVKWRKGKNGKSRPYFEIVPTEQPLSYRTKVDYKTNFVEFYRFLSEYVYVESKQTKELPDITRYFRLKKPDDFQEIVVAYIPDDEIHVLLDNIRNPKFKAYVQISLMSGARPCEATKIRYGREHNLYKNDEGQWVIRLPKIKRVSYVKFPFVIDMYEDELYPHFDSLNLRDGDYEFEMSDDTVRKLMKHYTTKYLNKDYTPKVLRKTARMIRSNAGYSNDWINKLMGHAPGSKIQGHYVNYKGIKNDHEANDRLKAQQYPSHKQDYERIKLELEAAKEQLKNMPAMLDKLLKERLPDLINAEKV